MKVFLNGHFVEADRAGPGAFDAGFLHAIGLFETMQAFHGRVFRLEAHLDRLIQSARELGLAATIKLDPLCQAVEQTLKENQLLDARVRLTVTGGNLAMLSAARGEKQPPHQPTVLITATPPTLYPPEFFTAGVAAVVADARANPFDPLAGHKTTQYWSRLKSLSQAAAAGAGEALWLSVTNHLCGGAVSNAFIVKEERLLTPIARGEETQGAIPSATLPGITRGVVLESAEQLNIPVEKRMLDIRDILEADEIFLTNSSWQVLPVVKVEHNAIGTAGPGAVTRTIREHLLKTLARECPAV